MTEEGEAVVNWRRLDAHLTTSGQPSEAQLGILQRLGIRHVINLALHSHEKALPDEAASLRALGIGYTHIPVQFDHPTEEDFSRFRTTFGALRHQPLHVHCILNYRVSAFIYRYRRQVLRLTEAQARPDLTAIWEPDAVWADFIGWVA